MTVFAVSFSNELRLLWSETWMAYQLEWTKLFYNSRMHCLHIHVETVHVYAGHGYICTDHAQCSHVSIATPEYHSSSCGHPNPTIYQAISGLRSQHVSRSIFMTNEKTIWSFRRAWYTVERSVKKKEKKKKRRHSIVLLNCSVWCYICASFMSEQGKMWKARICRHLNNFLKRY